MDEDNKWWEGNKQGEILEEVIGWEGCFRWGVQGDLSKRGRLNWNREARRREYSSTGEVDGNLETYRDEIWITQYDMPLEHIRAQLKSRQPA